jgi:hypothetical protein
VERTGSDSKAMVRVAGVELALLSELDSDVNRLFTGLKFCD